MMPSLAVLALNALGAQEIPDPRLVTAETLSYPSALARLQEPGQILFSDGFERASSLNSYFEVQGQKEGLAKIETAPGLARTGAGCLSLAAPDRNGEASGSSVHFALKNGHEKLHVRTFMKFAADYDQGNLNHTGPGLSGYAGPNKWAAMGKAGLRPKGDDRFSTRLEPWIDYRREKPPGWLFAYTYWMDMKQDRDGNYWGNFLGPNPQERFIPPRGRWICLELMVKLNSFDRGRWGFDGELAAWLDGRLYLHYKGIRWRSSPEVLLRNFALDIYIHSATGRNQVWFDDVVLSTGYVGPTDAG